MVGTGEAGGILSTASHNMTQEISTHLHMSEYVTIIGLEVHAQLLTAEQDVLRLQPPTTPTPAQHPRLPGLHGHARRAAGHQRARPSSTPS